MTLKNIDVAKNVITFGCFVTPDEIETSLKISRTCVNSILHDHLKVKNVFSGPPQFISREKARLFEKKKPGKKK